LIPSPIHHPKRGTNGQPAMRHTKSDVIARTIREFEELDRLVARLQPADWDRLVPRPETRDPWTVKDALVHIVYWKTHTARVIRGEKRPPEARGLDVPRLNHLVWEQWRDRSPVDVIGWHHAVHADVMRTLANTPEEWFGRREHAAEWPLDFDGHSAGHRLKDLLGALSS
jgi:mycothiol maleylpyruvate isomerase-like protein